MPEYEVPHAAVAALPTSWLLIRLAVSLGLVVGLIYLSAWILRRVGQRPRGGAAKGMAQVLEVLPLGPGRALYAVEMGSRVLLLSATAQAVSLLYEVPLAEVQRTTAAPLPAEEVAPDVAGMLTRLRAFRPGTVELATVGEEGNGRARAGGLAQRPAPTDGLAQRPAPTGTSERGRR
jgi:flagellar biosynthetic protein FliO